MSKKEKLLFDNNSIDSINANHNLFITAKNKFDYYISPSVLEELSNIPDSKKENRIKNLISLIEMQPKFIFDSVFILNHSRLDCSCLGNGKVYHEILNESGNNVRDAIIADTAVSNDCFLLTNDKDLYNKMKKLNYKCLNLTDLTKIMEQK